MKASPLLSQSLFGQCHLRMQQGDLWWERCVNWVQTAIQYPKRQLLPAGLKKKPSLLESLRFISRGLSISWWQLRVLSERTRCPGKAKGCPVIHPSWGQGMLESSWDSTTTGLAPVLGQGTAKGGRSLGRVDSPEIASSYKMTAQFQNILLFSQASFHKYLLSTYQRTDTWSVPGIHLPIVYLKFISQLKGDVEN